MAPVALQRNARPRLTSTRPTKKQHSNASRP